MRAILGALLVATALLLVAGFGLWWSRPAPPSPPRPVAVTDVLGGFADDQGFSVAQHPGGIEWPADHGPHPDYRSEWWYFSGALSDDASGDEFGFQLAFFRFALRPGEASVDSPWSVPQIYMAHFALTNVQAQTHRVVERFARPANAIAGAVAVPFAVWLDDWTAESRGDDFTPLRLRARDADTGIALDLSLAAGKPLVLQADQGLSAKGPEPGNASWYYSATRLPASGSVEWDGRRLQVSGNAWLDREWSTSSLGADVAGWDWFGLQLDDGRDLMLYVLRDHAGQPRPQSAGTWVDQDGGSQRLTADTFHATPLAYWRSPDTGIHWPVEWRLRLTGNSQAGQATDSGPEDQLLLVRAVVNAQEQDLSVRYWEGLVDVLTPAGERIGRGYLEMTGYGPDQANSTR